MSRPPATYVVVLRGHLAREAGGMIYHGRPRRGTWDRTPCGVRTEQNDKPCYSSLVDWFRLDVARLFARPCRRCYGSGEGTDDGGQ